MKRLVSTLTLVLVVLLLALLSRPAAAQSHIVTVPLYDVQNRNVGTATLTETSMGLMVEVAVSGMLPVAGDRALMVHAVSNCALPNYGAGIGALVAMLPPVQFFPNGSAAYKQVVTNVRLPALMDSDGSALVLHADVPPNPGDIIICGEIPTGMGTSAPAQPTSAPAQPTIAPSQPTTAPASPTMPSAAPTTAPATATPVPAQPTQPPAQPTQAPGGQTGDLVITAVNKEAEYVDIRNRGTTSVNLTGWTILSERGPQRCMLSGTIAAGATLRVWTQAVMGSGISCGLDNEIWRNDLPDPAVLIDPFGREVSRFNS